jgi:hypothetical protein
MSDEYAKIMSRRNYFDTLDLEERFARTVFFVEGNAYDAWKSMNVTMDAKGETTILKKDFKGRDWEQHGMGFMRTIGEMPFKGTDWPVTLQFNWYFIDGFPVCFYEPTSVVVNYDMIEKFMEPHTKPVLYGGLYHDRQCRIDALYRCLHALDDIEEAMRNDKYLIELDKTPFKFLRYLKPELK